MNPTIYLIILGVIVSVILLGVAVFRQGLELRRLREISDEREGKNRHRAAVIHAAIKNLQRPILRNRELTKLVNLVNDPEVPDMETLSGRLSSRGNRRHRHD